MRTNPRSLSCYLPAKEVAPRPRSSIPATISEERLYEALDAKLPGGAVRLRQLVMALEERGASPRFTASTIVLQGAVADRTLTLLAGSVDPVKARATVVLRECGGASCGTRPARCCTGLLPLSGVPCERSGVTNKETQSGYEDRNSQPAAGRLVVAARSVVGRW